MTQTTAHPSHISPFSLASLKHAGETLGNVMYGSKVRTNITLAFAFGMLVTGITLMQAAANGGLCAVAG